MCAGGSGLAGKCCICELRLKPPRDTPCKSSGLVHRLRSKGIIPGTQSKSFCAGSSCLRVWTPSDMETRHSGSKDEGENLE